MMIEFSKKETHSVLNKFEIDLKGDTPSEKELFEMLCDQIAYMIEYRMEFLLSLLYRNDILEHKISFALSPHCPNPANIALAKLVMERQRKRIETKASIEVLPIEDIDEELKL
ncbi:MAG: hypothetical protein ACI9XO_004877 [Paraglaciecola sp.]|jgi:hypothetical protein